VAAFGRFCPVVSDLSGFERKFVRWCRICPVASDWFVGFSVGFSILRIIGRIQNMSSYLDT